jgi:GntR family transcriptional regulator
VRRRASDAGDGRENASLVTRLRAVWETAARAGDPLPSEEALAAALSVSRPALREALVRLEAEGLVRRQIGAGTYPNVVALEMGVRLDATTEFSEMVRDAGFEPTVDVLEHGWTQLDADDAKLLEADVGARAYRTVKRWLADGVPAMLALDVVPCPGGDAPADPRVSVLDLTLELTGRQTDWLCAWPEPVALPTDVARLLARRPGEPALRLEQVGVDRRGSRLFAAHEYHVRGPLRYGVIRTVRRR